MPSIKALEALAEMAAAAGSKILPSRFGEIAESLASRAGLSSNKVLAQSGRAAEGGADNLAPIQITESSALKTALTPQQLALSQANESLVGHITSKIPQVQDGKLDWILGGSAASNALAKARSLTLLDTAQLPAIVPARSMALSAEASASYGRFLRPLGDVDAFVVNNGANRFLSSPYIGALEMELPDAAKGALTAVGEARSSRIMQAVKMEFDFPEVAAIEYAGKTVYLTGPGQLMGNKLRQVLFSYAPADARKLTGDFSHLLDGASSLYTEAELLQFGRQALQRNGLLYRREVNVPWDKSDANTKFLGFLRRVLESEERNGVYLRGLKVDPVDSMTAMRLFEKHPLAKDKSALADFINRHAERVQGFDIKGSAERSQYLMQSGTGKAAQKFLDVLDALPARTGGKDAGLARRLQELDIQLGKDFNLPALYKGLRPKS